MTLINIIFEITHPYMPEPGAVSVEYVTVRKSISIVSEWD